MIKLEIMKTIEIMRCCVCLHMYMCAWERGERPISVTDPVGVNTLVSRL